MSKKWRGGKNIKNIAQIFSALVISLTTSVGILQNPADVRAESEDCPELEIIFVRGSGGTRWVDDNYNAFKDAIEEKMELTEISHEFLDLDYPAVGVGFTSWEDFKTIVGAGVGSGDAYEFGESVDKGVLELVRVINETCPSTKFVAGGYSQGAMVVSKALPSLNPDKLIFAATFGDPKIYLPEGEGAFPDACHNKNLSEYRYYVPNCKTYEGLLGSYRPYQPEGFSGKVGTWCNKDDVFCSPYLSITSHVSYISDKLYEDASKVIFDKICAAFGIPNNYVSEHDTVILIDSTGSMEDMIKKYKAEALRLANETLNSGGRVAIYEYRDIKDPFYARQLCGFDDCTTEKVEEVIAAIKCDGGGDGPESLMSAAWTAMKELKWRWGTTKSLIVLTDADYHNPDHDGKTFEMVAKLSKEIDPVNFYIVTTEEWASYYQELADATDGAVAVLGVDEVTLTDRIIERYDSLPRVEESAYESSDTSVRILNAGWSSSDSARVEFETNGGVVLAILNDAILGVAAGTSLEISGLDAGVSNVLRLVPFSAEKRGAAVEVELNGLGEMAAIPKAPNTGKR